MKPTVRYQSGSQESRTPQSPLSSPPPAVHLHAPLYALSTRSWLLTAGLIRLQMSSNHLVSCLVWGRPTVSSEVDLQLSSLEPLSNVEVTVL